MVTNEPVAGNADNDCEKTFQYEDPGLVSGISDYTCSFSVICAHAYPAWLPSHAVHLRNGCRKQTSKRSRKRCSRKKDSRSDAQLAPLVPTAEVVVHSGEESVRVSTPQPAIHEERFCPK